KKSRPSSRSRTNAIQATALIFRSSMWRTPAACLRKNANARNAGLRTRKETGFLPGPLRSARAAKPGNNGAHGVTRPTIQILKTRKGFKTNAEAVLPASAFWFGSALSGECKPVKDAALRWVDWDGHLIRRRRIRNVNPVAAQAGARAVDLQLQAHSGQGPREIQLLA